MATEAKLKVNISADGSQVKTEVQGVARAVQDAAGRMASAYASVSVQIKSVSAAVSGFQKALGIWNQVAVAIDATVKIIQKGLDVIRNFGKASEEAAESAAKFAERANGTGLDVSLYDAIAAAAKTAGAAANVTAAAPSFGISDLCHPRLQGASGCARMNDADELFWQNLHPLLQRPQSAGRLG